MDDREVVDRVLMMKKEEGLDYEVSETVTGQWSLEKKEVIMTEEVTEQVVFIEQKEVFEVKGTVEEQWSVENKGEVVMITEEGEQGWMNKKPVVKEQRILEKGRVVMTTEKVEQGTEGVFMTTDEERRNTLVGVHEMVEEHWSGEVVMSEEVERVSVDEKQVVEVNEVREERWSVGKEEVVMTEEVEQVASVLEKEEFFEGNEMVTGQLSVENEEVVKVNETVVEGRPFGEEDFLEYTKTIYDRWKKQGLEIADGKISEDDDNMWETKERCEARMEYEKAVRKFLTHSTQCSKCVKKKTEIRTISNLIVSWFMVQFVHQLFISSVVKSGGLLRRARFIIKHAYESVVTTSAFVYITTSYVSITQTLQRFLISKQQHHAAVDEVPDVNTHDQVVDPCPPVIVTSPGVTKQGLIRRTWFVLEQSYHLIRVVTVKAYVSIKQTVIVIRRHTFGEVLEEVNENSQDDVFVDQSTTVVVTPSGFNIHRLIRRIRLVLQETQGFLCRTKVVLVFSSVRDVTIKAYISVKQTINRLLRKKPAVVTPQPGSNDKKDSKVLARRRLFFFGVVCVLLCLSGTMLFMVNREYHIAVTTKEDGSKSNKQVGSDGVIGKKDDVVSEKKDDKATTKQTDGKVDAKHEKDHVVNEKKDDKTAAKKSDGKVDAKHEKDRVVNEKMDDKTASKKSDGKADTKHEKDHVVNEKKDDKTAAKQSDGKVDAKHGKDHVVNEKKDDKTTVKQSDGKVDAKHGKDHVVNEKRDGKTTAKQSDGKVDAKHEKGHVVNEKKDDKTAAKQSDGKADAKHEKDHVVNEKKDDKTAAKQSDGKMDARKEVGDLVTEKGGDNAPVVTEGFIRAWISYVTTLVLNIHISTWSTIKQTYHRAFTWKNNLVTDQRYGGVASNEVDVQEKDDVVRLLKTWIGYAIALAQRGLQIEKVNLITGISVLSFVFLCVYIAIKNLRRTTINVVTTVVKGVTSGSLFVARTIVVSVGAFLWVTVNIPRRTWSVLYTRVVTAVTASDTKGDGKAAANKQSKERVDAGNGAGDLVTNKTDDGNAVAKNEDSMRSRITYVTTLVVNIHIRTWSTIKHTYHRVFTGVNDGVLVPKQGDGNIGPNNVSENGRVVIRQMKYIISQVLKVHKWFVVEQVYHRILKWREQTKVVINQDANVVTNQTTAEDVVVGPTDTRVIMWSSVKQTSYQLVVRIKLRLISWTTTHVTTRVQTGLLRIWSAIKLERVLNIKAFGQATKKLLRWLRHLVSKEEILKSIVYGGLTEILTSISIVAFFADFDTTILNVIAFALAGIIGGCFFFVTNIWELKKGGGNTYTEQLGRVNYFPFHATLAMLSFIIFGMIPPSTFVFSFLKTNDKKITIWVVSAVSILCLSLLAIFKAYVTSITYRFKYVKTVLWYHFIALGVSICSYLASKMVKGSIEDIGLFDTTTCDAMSMSRHNYKV